MTASMEAARRWLVGAAAAVLLPATALAQTVAFKAPSQAVPFKVPAQAAQTGITEFARQAHLQILASADALRGRRTGAVVGDLALDDALSRLLAGSDLMVAFNDGRTVSLAERPSLGPAAPASRTESRDADLVRADPAAAILSSSVPLAGVTVVGSQIAGAKITGALPVTVLGPSDIAATGALSAGDFFRGLPQAGDVTFNEQTLGGNSPNAARGDVSTVTLRGLGQGNTLLLLNGRRMVQHPTSQTDGFGSPVFGYNANAVPLGGLERVEILRDGASALYGSDAVAGVINNVVRSDFRGLQLDGQYGFAQGTNLREYRLNSLAGARFAEGRGSVELVAGYTGHSDIKAADQAFTRSANRVGLVAGTDFAGNPGFDGRGANAPFGAFQSPMAFGAVRSGGAAITNASGVFHVQPATMAGCTVSLGGGLCAGAGSLTGADQRPLRFDANQTFPDDSVQPALIDRVNLYGFASYDLTPDVRLYSELGYYTATTDAWVPSVGPLPSIPITLAADAYWNPFGPVGSPNRLPGLNIPAAGLPLTIVSYNVVDGGANEDKVVNAQYRALFGVKGQWRGWSYDSGLLYNAATVDDTSTAMSSTLFQQALNRTTPDAYNPFNGGSLTDPSVGDPTPSPAGTIGAARIKETRANTTQLALWDLKLSRPDLLMLPGGAVGLASGLEVRYETYRDNRDARQDGSIPYVDSVTGVRYGDDLFGASPSPDVGGARAVESLYGEVAVPLVGPDMHVPFVRSIDLQAAGRFENYSDVGAVAKPKVAGSWDVVDGVRLRGSWSQGFRAPNLETLHSPILQRSNQGVDYIRCDMDLRAGRIASFSACSQSFPVVRIYAGNTDLKPEESESYSFGLVLHPKFGFASRWGALTVSIDRWHIAQTGVVGVFDYQNAISLDYLMRLNGSANPNVMRAPVTADDIALAAGTGLAPVGQLLTVNGVYQNLQPRTAEGVDVGLSYRLSNTRAGDFGFDFNYAKLTSFFQQPSADQQVLLNGQAAGTLSKSIAIASAANLIGQGANPSDKWSATLTWRRGPAEAGLFAQYTAPIRDVGVVDAVGDTFIIRSQLTTNLYGQWTFGRGHAGSVAVRLGVRNIDGEPPPLSSGGYLASLYAPMGRYWYASIKQTF